MHRRSLMKNAVIFGASLPWLRGQTALGQTVDEAYLAHVHPELREILSSMLPYTSQATPSKANLAEMRRMMGAYARKPLAEVPFKKQQVPGQPGQPPVTVFVINAGKPGTRPAILHTHGGGYISGAAEFDVPNIQAICKELDCVAVSVEYRLAPETTYAGSIEDNYAALEWLHANAAALGVDPKRIAVMGESAGGGHAALLAITARDRGKVPLAFQCLVYPMLDDRTGTTRTTPPHVGKVVWNAAANRFGWQSFLGTTPGARTAPRGAVPARVENLAGLPPCWIGVGSIDLFHDEDVDYAQRLNDAGVPTELIVVPGAFHGFDNLTAAPISRWFNAAKLDALRRGLGLPVA